jgi:hypothetical protein
MSADEWIFNECGCGGEVRRIALKQVCERLVIQQVIHQ